MTTHFTADGIRDRLGTQNIISSEVDLDKKEITHFNFKENKVRRFRELYGDAGIESFYTDSYNDRAVMKISEKVFLVKNGKIKARRASRCAACGLPVRQHLPFRTRVHHLSQKGLPPEIKRIK